MKKICIKLYRSEAYVGWHVNNETEKNQCVIAGIVRVVNTP